MAKVVASGKDVKWNYAGTIVSMASGFILLPLLLLFLSADDLGLWYIFVAMGNLVILFEFGFNPTFARNITYCVSGARRLSKQGCDFSSVSDGIDFHLLGSILKATKVIFAAIAVIALVLASTLGTVYISYVGGLGDTTHILAWAIFCTAIVINLFFDYCLTFLRGFGDIAGENRAKTISRLVQLGLSALLLALGFGLIGAALGYLANSLLLRLFSYIELRKHSEIYQGLSTCSDRVTRQDVKNVLRVVSHVAWRDGLVMFSNYASTQAMSIICSISLGLAETGVYSVLLQLATAVYSFASVHVKTCYPMFQSAYAAQDRAVMESVISRGITAYYALFAIGTVGVIVVVFPLLPLIKPSFAPDILLFLAISLYLFLWNQHCIFCNLIVSMNKIPYMTGFLVAACLGIFLSFVFSGTLGLGAWGLIAGQFVSQAVYNNWRWPLYIFTELGVSFLPVLRDGFSFWIDKLNERVRTITGRFAQ